MELSVVSNGSLPEDAILSVRAGSTRRQAALNSGRPFRFPQISMAENPLKIDILKTVGSAYLVLKPKEEQYKVVFTGSEGDLSCEIEIKQVGGAETSVTANLAETKKSDTASAKEAKDYLEGHQVLQFVQAVLQTVCKEKPEDPYAYIARHFLGGYNPSEEKAARNPDKPADLPVEKAHPAPSSIEASPR